MKKQNDMMDDELEYAARHCSAFAPVTLASAEDEFMRALVLVAADFIYELNAAFERTEQLESYATRRQSAYTALRRSAPRQRRR